MGESNAVEKKSFMDKATEKITVLAEPFGKLSQIPFMQALQEGFAATIPLIMFGSIFLIVFCAVNGQLGFTLFGGLAKYSDQLLVPYNLTSGFLGFYATLAIGTAYAKKLDLNVVNANLIVAAFFFFINYNSVAEGLGTTPFSTSGIFCAMIGSWLSIRAYKFFIDKKVVIKLPDMVPPAIGDAFTSLIPYFVILLFAWVVRTCLNFNFMEWSMSLLAPILNLGDNVFMFTLNNTLSGLFWSVGIHYENMTSSIVVPLTTSFLADNQAAVAAGTALSKLPHIWTYGLTTWTVGRVITNYPMLVLLLRSKVPGFKQLGMAATVPAIFCICEPITFGVPVVMNPFMMVPLILANFVGSLITYGAFAFGFVNKPYTTSPWAAPSLLSGILQTGDWRSWILILVLLVVGVIIYYPFFTAYEKATLKRIEEEQTLADEG